MVKKRGWGNIRRLHRSKVEDLCVHSRRFIRQKRTMYATNVDNLCVKSRRFARWSGRFTGDSCDQNGRFVSKPSTLKMSPQGQDLAVTGLSVPDRSTAECLSTHPGGSSPVILACLPPRGGLRGVRFFGFSNAMCPTLHFIRP